MLENENEDTIHEKNLSLTNPSIIMIDDPNVLIKLPLCVNCNSLQRRFSPAMNTKKTHLIHILAREKIEGTCTYQLSG